MRANTLFFIIVASAALLFAGCQTAQQQVNAEAILQPEKGGDFRGVRIGDKLKLVRRNEQATSVYSMPDELIYRFEPDEADSTWYEISYSFNEDGLNHINLDVYPASSELQEHLLEDFMAHYKQRYGDGKLLASHVEWRAMTEQGHLVTISLSRGISKETRSCIRLVYNESNP